MNFRRKNKYLEKLLESIDDKMENELAITGGATTEYFKPPYQKFFKSIKEFNVKWANPTTVEFECDRAEINQDNVKISIVNRLTTFMNTGTAK